MKTYIEFLKENLRYSEIDSIANNTYTDVKFRQDLILILKRFLRHYTLM